MVHIKNHVPVVVTQEVVDEYGSVESAVKGRVVEEEKVCNELNRISLIEFNAIGFDSIELIQSHLVELISISFPVAFVKVWGQLQEEWWPYCSDSDDHCPGQARQLGATCSRDRRPCDSESGG